jgi:hypothetical protein
MATVAEIVNEWFQGEPTPERQQNMRRATLIADLEQQAAADLRRAHSDGYTEGYHEAMVDEDQARYDSRKTFTEQERAS